jgi:TPR repeat protein
MKRAEAGDGGAEFEIALYEKMGRTDIERAKYWFERASKHGEQRADGHLKAMKRKAQDSAK